MNGARRHYWAHDRPRREAEAIPPCGNPGGIAAARAVKCQDRRSWAILAGFKAADFIIGGALAHAMMVWLALREARWSILPATAPVLSETFYRGWHAVVNGTGQRIYRVNGGLRGIISSDGEQPRCSGRPAGIILRRSAPQPAGFRRNGAVHRRPWPLNFLESAQCFPGDSLESRAACGWRLPPLRFSFQELPWNSL